MIVSDRYQFVFVSTPKCCTNTMYEVLPKHFKGARILPGFHRTAVPPRYRQYFTWTIIRNPYARAVSIWYSTTVRATGGSAQRYGYEAIGSTSFERFLEWLLTRPGELAQRSLDVPQAVWLVPCRIDRHLRLESLADELRSLPFWRSDIDVPIRNPSDGCKPWPEYITRRARDLILEWANIDFEAFGYPREIDCAPDGAGDCYE